MEPFRVHRGIVALLDRANVDTDQIIPKQFLKAIGRTGFGPSLFFDWRYLPDGRPDPAFELNAERYRGASILLTRNNFGCGSSREHAVWAVVQYGFRVVIAPWQDRDGQRTPAFADIFRNNSTKNGLLTVEVSPRDADALFAWIAAHPGAEATVDLEQQGIECHGAGAPRVAFEIEPAVKDFLMLGLDDIGRTLRFAADISSFEQRHDVQMPSA
jgi:3-isopropylmalate/(R)-2-methylmalate dehydratase small subunit